MTLLHSSRPIVLQPGEGQAIPGPGGLTLKASADQTNGSIGFLEATSEPGFSGPVHIHHGSDELFYVLGGRFQFLVGEDVVDATAGSFVFIPRGTVHGPKVVGSEPGRVVMAFVPGGPERSFEEFAELFATQDGAPDLTGDRAQAIARKYRSEFVGPPL